jgi:hypothetical protein
VRLQHYGMDTQDTPLFNLDIISYRQRDLVGSKHSNG